MTDVKCKVESCHYWGHEDICEADSIVVDNNKKHGAFGKMEAGDLDVTDTAGRPTGGAGRSSGMLANRSEETLCKTFRPKESQTSR